MHAHSSNTPFCVRCLVLVLLTAEGKEQENNTKQPGDYDVGDPSSQPRLHQTCVVVKIQLITERTAAVLLVASLTGRRRRC